MTDEEQDGFSNRPIDTDRLPDYRRVSLESVASAYLPYSVVTTTAFWLVLAAAAAVLRLVPLLPFDAGWWVVAVPVVAAAWFGAIAWLDARRRGWAVREHDLIYRYGVIWRKTVVVPFARIQHVETTNGPLERLFGLMRVKCFTAGGMSADLSVEGLDVASARKVRQYLLEQIRDDEHPASDSDGNSVDDDE